MTSTPPELPPEPSLQVTVQVQHVATHSQPGRELFVYFITIENRGDRSWQLLARHWDIGDGTGQMTEVDGEGVVGEKPLLAPGAQYTYNSFVTLRALPGVMSGYYTVQDAWGERARALIPPFRLDTGERVLN